MDSIVRITAEQGGEITSTQNLLDFNIPNDGSVIDLSKSYLSFRFRQTTTDADANIADAVFNHAMTFNTKTTPQTDKYVEPVALIKHANLESQNKGFVENLRDVNVLRLNQNNYFMSEENKLQSQLNNVIGVQSNHTWGYISPLIQAGNDDITLDTNVTVSQNINAEHRVHLKDVFNYCKNQAHSMSQNGQTRVHFEIDFDRLGQDNTAFVADSFSVGGTKEGYGEIADAAASDVITLQKVFKQNYKEEIPYYIGMPIVTTGGQINSLAHGSIKRKITNITYNSSTGQVALKLNAAIAGAGASDNLFIGPVEASTKSFRVFDPQLVLYKRSDSPQIENPYFFTTFSSEKDNLGSVAEARRQYELEGDCVNMIVVSKDEGGSVYSDKNLASYRVAVNNRDLTNRNVNKSSPLMYDRLNRYAMNAGLQPKHLLAQKLQRAHQNDMRTRGGAFDDTFPVFEPMPLTQNMKLVELNLVAGAGTMGDIQIFKELRKAV